MWIVQVALRRPYTFIVLALLLPLIGALAIMGTPLRPEIVERMLARAEIQAARDRGGPSAAATPWGDAQGTGADDHVGAARRA